MRTAATLQVYGTVFTVVKNLNEILVAEAINLVVYEKCWAVCWGSAEECLREVIDWSTKLVIGEFVHSLVEACCALP